MNDSKESRLVLRGKQKPETVEMLVIMQGDEEKAHDRPAPKRPFLRAFRPVWWWLVFSAVLLAWDYHRRHAPFTHAVFEANVQDQSIPCQTKLDGVNRRLDVAVPIGWHEITISGADTEPWVTRRFIWYGRNDLGKIALQWKTGRLAVQVQPLANRLDISGPHLRLLLTNSVGFTSAVPVGKYRLEAGFSAFSKSSLAEVAEGKETQSSIAVPVGGLSLAASHTAASFQLSAANETGVGRSGKLPEELPQLPAGIYHLVARRGEIIQEQDVTVTADFTNQVFIRFQYGSVRFDTRPGGATVVDTNGHALGQTPFTITELVPAMHRFTARKSGFADFTWQTEVMAEGTNQLSAELLSEKFLQAMAKARGEAEGPLGNLSRGLEFLDVALEERPGNEEALRLRSLFKFQIAFREAERLAARTEYTQALASLEAALKEMPANPDALKLKGQVEIALSARDKAAKEQLLVEQLSVADGRARRNDYSGALALLDQLNLNFPSEPRVAEWRERIRSAQSKYEKEEAGRKAKARLDFPSEQFTKHFENQRDAGLFETQHWRYRSDMVSVESALRKALSAPPVGLKDDQRTMPNDETVVIVCAPKISNVLLLIGRRLSAGIVIGKVTDTEVEVHLKFWHYSFSKNVQIINGVYSESSFQVASQLERDRLVTQFKAALDKLLNP